MPNRSVEWAGSWLLQSGIQNRSKKPALHGGVASWYETDTKIYPFLYSEITGYALTTYVYLHSFTKDRKYLAAAKIAAHWLLKNAMDQDGGVKTRLYLVKDYVSPNYCFHQGRVYSFDASMVGYGLIQYFKCSGDRKMADAIEKILGFLIHRMRKNDGTFYPYFDSKTRACGEDLEKWSDQGGTFHGKLALFLVDYFRLLRDKRHKQFAIQLLNQIASSQLEDGRFVTSQLDQSTHLHPHAYTLEGLLYAGVHLGQKDYLQSAYKGFLWMLRGVSVDGSVSSIYTNGSFSHHERSDIVAQTLRIGSILYAIQPKQITPYLPTLEKVRNHLIQFQHKTDKKQKGGFVYGSATDGLLRVHLNAWSTMFSLQALQYYDQFVLRKNNVKLEHFI